MEILEDLMNNNVTSIFIILCLFIAIGLMLEYEGRMKVQDNMNKKMNELEYIIKKNDIIKNEIMKSCLIGDKTH